MTSLTGIEHEVVEETKWDCLGVAAIFLTEGSSITVDLRDVWKLLESDFELAKFSKAWVGIFTSPQLPSIVHEWVYIEVDIVRPLLMLNADLHPKLTFIGPGIRKRNLREVKRKESSIVFRDFNA